MKPTSSYLICSAPRTGSTLLAEALAKTGVAGKPREYFDIHERNERHWMERLQITDDAEYLEKVIEAGTTPNGVFGAKVHWHQLQVLTDKLRKGRAQTDGTLSSTLSAALPALRYIWIRRRNKVAQAISYYRASQTDQWRRQPSTAPDRPAAAHLCEFDFHEIDRLVGLVEEFDAQWQRYFSEREISPLVLVYEEFIADYEGTVRRAMDYLEVGGMLAPIPAPPLLQQADEISAEWEETYRRMKHDAVPAKSPDFIGAGPPSNPDLLPIKSDDGEVELPLIAYCTNPKLTMPLVVAPRDRGWMEKTPQRFANRCLPLLIANQAGWHVLSAHKLAVTWDGGNNIDSLRVEHLGGEPPFSAASHFGSGILTWTIPYLFRTTPGFNLLVRGPANMPKDGISALEGIVEADWADATFTMNWKMTRPNHTVTFEIGEPVAMIVPQVRGELECFRPEIRAITDDPQLDAAHTRWSNSRKSFNADLKEPGSGAQHEGWQRHYFRGESVAHGRPLEHQSKLALAPFDDRRQAHVPLE